MFVADVAEKAEGDVAPRLFRVLLHGEEIGQHLRGVKLVRQPVPDRHAGMGGELLDDGLAEAAILDPVEHAAQNAGRVLDGLLAAQMRARGAQIGDIPRPGSWAATSKPARVRVLSFSEDQRDFLALQQFRLGARVFRGFQIGPESPSKGTRSRRGVKSRRLRKWRFFRL